MGKDTGKRKGGAGGAGSGAGAGSSGGGEESVRRSSRSTGAVGPRAWDERQRMRQKLARLSFLERDNHQQDNTHMMKVQRVEEDEMVGISDPKRKKKKASLAEKTKNRTLELMMEESKAEQRQIYGVAYSDICCPPPRAPGRKLCSVCGFKAPYTCTITGKYYCCRACYAVHEETRLKGLK